ncbi:MAG: ParB N-terminal domain-containing protein [Hungatella hathewayi]|uniref:ParB N-terminal domain-containing protein n=1 Tax=Hungatella hathewayi TaxID=154046 RepID=UPI003994C154
MSEIVPLPGTYVKDTPRKDYGDMIADIKKNGLQKPVILRQGEKGELQLVDGFHRCKALEQAGMLEVRADVYEMALTDASRYRKEHRKTRPAHSRQAGRPTPPSRKRRAEQAPAAAPISPPRTKSPRTLRSPSPGRAVGDHHHAEGVGDTL